MNASNIFQIGNSNELGLFEILKTSPIGTRVQFDVIVANTPMKPIVRCNPNEATCIVFPMATVMSMGYAPLGRGLDDGVFLIMPKKVSYQQALELLTAYLGFRIDPIPAKAA